MAIHGYFAGKLTRLFYRQAFQPDLPVRLESLTYAAGKPDVQRLESLTYSGWKA